MTLQELKKKLADGNMSYTFNFAKKADCQYLFEQYGGEENMRQKFPRIYDAFQKSRENAMKKVVRQGQPSDGADTVSGKVGKLVIDRIVTKSKAVKSVSRPLCRLKTELSCNFVDGTKDVCDDKPAEEWKGISIQVKIKEKNSPKYVLNKNIVVESAQQYHDFLHTREGYLSEFDNKKYDIEIDLTGMDPAGMLNKKIIKENTSLGDVETYNIYNVVLDDPAAKNAKHQNSGEIAMLYGRMDEQAVYADADYKDGDYYKNTFSDGKVHLLLPLKGDMILDYKTKPLGLTKPDGTEPLSRSTATYDYKGQIFTYRTDLKDDQLYDKMKGCFKADEYQAGVRTRVQFDVRIPDTGRSDLDWHCDVKGIQNAEPKTIMLDACFVYSVQNALGVEAQEQISIMSRSKDFMESAGRKYYEFDRQTNTVYIPPITIYWGCFAKDVRIRMADGSEKEACAVAQGDRVSGYGNQELTVESIVTGRDKTILLIETKEHGGIRVSGGHPMMCRGAMKRAVSIVPGDMLDLADGGLAEVTRAEVVDYDDTVYNFTFAGEEEGVYLAANGFYSGDLRMQNKKRKTKAAGLTQEEKEFIAEMKAFHKMSEEGTLP